MKDKIDKILASKKVVWGLSALGLFLLAAGASWAIFSYLSAPPSTVSPTPEGVQKARSGIDPSLPKTEDCPINGAKYTKQEREIWEARRPITVVLENHVDSRPPSGLSRADVVYEAVAEGGITRFLGVFYCGVSASDIRIAPVRSARIYYINWAIEYGKSPIFVHVGGANNFCSECPGRVKTPGTVAREVLAIETLDKLGWRYASGNAFDLGSNVGFPVAQREPERLGREVAWEHVMATYSDRLFEEAQKREFGFEDSEGDPWSENFVSWKFTGDNPSSSSTAKSISFEFWSNQSDYNVEWRYDESNNKYLRFNAGKEHTDLDSKEQLSAKNVIVQFVKGRGPVDKEKHMFYTTIGEGKILVFQNGGVVTGTWRKNSQSDRTRFFDDKGKEITFVAGPIWIEAVPTDNDIEY